MARDAAGLTMFRRIWRWRALAEWAQRAAGLRGGFEAFGGVGAGGEVFELAAADGDRLVADGGVGGGGAGREIGRASCRERV